MNKISVIVPCYKVEGYLPKCVESIMGQTYKDLEIILVDDGSPDSCPQICDEFARKDSRIKVIHKENGGLSSARNAGLDIATGDYIAFVDSDDWLELDMYEVLVSAISETNSDIATCDPYFCKYGTESRITISHNTGNRVVIEDNNDIFLHILEPKPLLRFEVWNKLFTRSLIGKTRFKVGQRYEDVYFDRIVFSRAKKLVAVDRALYNYLEYRPGSTVSSFNVGRLSKFEELDKYIEHFNDIGRLDISRSFQKSAAESAMYFYGAVLQFDQTSDVKDFIYKKYCDYYRGMKIHPFKYIVFYYAPWVLRVYLKIKNVYK